ncbi:MAG: hypothetical protein VXZ72_00230, partial [Chlamydiota bacterium]|nr:hypothetical protein [Chlamydiota bacterium]
MTTPNIVPKFNEEGKVGRPSRRFSEIHGKSVYSDKLILSIPEGQVLPTSSESQVYPSANHVYFDNGRLAHGSEVIAWQSEVTELKDVIDALLGDGSDGLSTLSSVVASIQSLDPGEDSFLELVNKINAIEANYATQADISSLASVADLSARMTNAEDRLTALEGQDTTVLTTITSQTGRLDALESTSSTTSAAIATLDSTVTGLNTLVGDNFTSLTTDITSAVGRVATLEDNTIPALSSTLSTLSTSFDTSVVDNAAALSALNSSVATLTTDLDQFNLNRLSDFSTLNTNIGALSTSLTSGLAGKVGTSDFPALLSAEFSASSSSLLSGYATLSDVSTTVSDTLTSSLSSYVTNTDLTDTLGSYATSTGLQQGLDGLSTTFTSSLATKADTSALANLVSTDNLAATLNSQLTESNLASSGSLSALGTFVTNTAQDSAEFAATTAVNALELDDIGSNSSTVDWSGYSFSIGSLLISSVNTFMCADPNIEFNVGQTREYLLEVPGGITWKRGDEDHDASILWDEENKLFHVRLAGPDTFRLLTVTDLDEINSTISQVTAITSANEAAILSNTASVEGVATNLSTYQSATDLKISGVESSVTELTDSHASLSHSVSNVSASVTLLSDNTDLAIQTLEGVDAGLQTSIDSLSTSLSDLQTLVSSEDTDIKQSISTLQASLSNLSGSLGGEDTNIRSDIEALTQSLTDTDALIRSDLGSLISGLTSSLDAQATNVTSNSNSIASISSSVSSLTSELASEITRVSELLASGDASITASINSLATSTAVDIQGVSAELSSLSTALDSATASISALNQSTQSDLDALESTIRALIDSSTQSASDNLQAHSDAQNPHGITKGDVGLSNVENVGISSWTGSSNLSTLGTITSGTWAGSPIDTVADGVITPSHINNTSDTFSFNNVAIQGQLTVSGDTIQVSTNEVNIGDNIIRLNADAVGAPTESAGVEIERGDADNVSILWDEVNDRWSMGPHLLETSGIRSDSALSITGASLEVRGETVFDSKVSVPHLDITSNMSLNTASSMIALNKDARYPNYPFVGTDADGNNTEDISLATSFAQNAYDIQGTAEDESAQLNNDSGLKVVLGGADNNNEFSYAFLFWDVSESKWRLSESATTTEEKDSSNSVERTEIVDVSSGAFDLLHSGHVGSTGQSSMGNTKLQVHSSDLSAIADLTPNNDDFLVRVNGAWSAINVAAVKQLVTYNTDDINEGNTNLYWTESRTRGAISVAGDLSYNSGTGVISFTEVGFTGKDTGDLAEGDNLYFTNSRARGAISVAGDLSYNAGTGVISYSTPDLYASDDFSTDFALKDTGDLAEGDNLYFTTARARAAVSVAGDLSYNSGTGIISFTTPDTDSVTEGDNNLYYTNARSRQAISASGSLSYNNGTGVISFTQRTDAAVKSLAADKVGELTTDDLTEGNTNLYWTEARVRGAIDVSGDLTYTENTGIISFSQRSAQDILNIVDISDTDDVTEGQTNLYHTTARARSALSVAGDLSYNSGTGVISYSNPSTDDVSEGDNKYHTDARARGAISAAGDLSYNNTTGVMSFSQRSDNDVKTLAATQIASSDTDDLSEGDTNLYFTNARARSAISASGSISYNSNTGALSFTQRTDQAVKDLADVQIAATTTDDIDEGNTNLYYTEGRVRGALSAGGDLSYNENSGTFSFTEVGFTGKDTDDLPEGTNLYFTDARAQAAITAGTGTTVSNGAVSVNEDQSSVITKINVPALFQKGSAWDRTVTTSNGDTVTSI